MSLPYDEEYGIRINDEYYMDQILWGDDKKEEESAMPKYAVWIGGTAVDYYLTKKAADIVAARWRDEGYEDVAIEKED